MIILKKILRNKPTPHPKKRKKKRLDLLSKRKNSKTLNKDKCQLLLLKCEPFCRDNLCLFYLSIFMVCPSGRRTRC